MNLQERNPYLAAIIALVLISGFLGVKYASTLRELKGARSIAESRIMNDKVLLFTRTFIEKILKSEKEVSFEDRLRLENAVRDLNDKEILDRWTAFTSSQTEREAQENVKDLLDTLTKKIKVQ